MKSDQQLGILLLSALVLVSSDFRNFMETNIIWYDPASIRNDQRGMNALFEQRE